MLTISQYSQLMDILRENSDKRFSTNQLRYKLGLPHEKHTEVRAALKRLERQKKVFRFGKGKFYWKWTSLDSKEQRDKDVERMVELIKQLFAQEGGFKVIAIEGDTFPIKEEIKQIPGVKWNKNNRQWEAHTQEAAEKVLERFPQLDVKVPGTPQQPGEQQKKGLWSDEPQPQVDNEQLEAMQKKIDEMEAEMKTLKANQPKITHLQFTEKKKLKVIEERLHPLFERVMFHINCGDNIMLVGPKGCGKTTLAAHVAKALDVDFKFLSLSGGVTETKLYGRSVPNISTGENNFHLAPFARSYKNGDSLFLLDEIDAADPNVLLSLNMALENGVISLDSGDADDAVIERGANQFVMAAANTFGNGANRKYVGRNQQDGAFVERFVQLEMGYDCELEIALCSDLPELVSKMHEYRQRIDDNRLEKELSTRFILRAANWLRHGATMEYVDKMLFTGWREDEVNKVKK